MILTESVVESAALSWLASLGYSVIPGPYLPQAEREHYDDVLLRHRLNTSLVKLNSWPCPIKPSKTRC